MTQPPHATPSPDSSWSGTGELHDGMPPAPPEPADRSRRGRRGLVLAGVAVGAVVLGGSGYAVASYVSGGGAQPEEVLPADTLAFAKVDLDPAAGQKMAVASLLEEFPDVGGGEDGGDLKSRLVTPLLEDNPWGLSYDGDVEPWLGDRMAVAVVPDPGSEAGSAPVVVLAVTDEDAMTDRLGAVAGDDFAFAVRDDYVLLGETQATVDRLAGTEDTLAEDDEYTGDLDALDGDQIAVAWADLAGVQGLLETTMGPAAADLGGQPLTGRMVLGVHAESDALEVEGLTRGADPATSAAPSGPTELVRSLPEDTLVGLSASGLGDAAVEAWDAGQGAGLPPEFQEEIAALGLDLPADLRTVLGSDVAVAVVGDLTTGPQFGLRAVTDDPQRAVDVLSGLFARPEVGIAVTATPVADGYVLASDPALADALAGDGGLGDTETFTDAVEDPDSASVIGFVDLGALVDQLAAQGGETAVQAEQFAALDALGFSAGSTDDGDRFVLRVTTG